MCGCDFYMSSKCNTRHPKCCYCRSGMSPEKSRINHEMDDCWEAFILAVTGTSYAKPDADTILSWANKIEIEEELQRIEAEQFFYGTPSSDK